MSAYLDSLLDRERLADIARHDAALVGEGRFADVVIEEEAPQEAPMEGSE